MMLDGSVEALLAAAGKSLESLPKDLVEAVKSGKVCLGWRSHLLVPAALSGCPRCL